MTVTTRTTKAGEIKRTITIAYALCNRCEARVCEQQRNKTTTDTYLLTRQRTDIGGIAFQVVKEDGEEVYDVLLNAPGGGHSCTCRWGSYKGHEKPCRHIECCLQSLREGRW